MKRDFNLVRSILLFTESCPNWFSDKDIQIDGYSSKEISYHLAIMMEEKLLFGKTTVLHNGDTISDVVRMTWKGHDFLDACRDNTRWARASEIFAQVNGVTFDIVKQTLIKLTTDSISILSHMS